MRIYYKKTIKLNSVSIPKETISAFDLIFIKLFIDSFQVFAIIGAEEKILRRFLMKFFDLNEFEDGSTHKEGI